jgi:adenylate kinase
MLGGPGAGKSTQASLLAAALGIPHVSSGELLREQQRLGTSAGRTAQTYMERGELVPDKIVTDTILARLGKPDVQHGAVLNGFPRTLGQARALDDWLEQYGGILGEALYLDVPREVLLSRLAGRRETVAGAGRADDLADVSAHRVHLLPAELAPILSHYSDRGLLRRIDTTGSVDTVHERILRTLGRGSDQAG